MEARSLFAGTVACQLLFANDQLLTIDHLRFIEEFRGALTVIQCDPVRLPAWEKLLASDPNK
jgi:hypothetical protein